ncbi:MAG: 50S ribosomal protein L30e [Euryarchaeota archaeon]|nr:50S ribosomal protein L30e [Euryarchaeota archaeon]
MIDLGRAIKAAATTGKVVYGVQQAEKAVRDDLAKMVIVAENCPSKILRPGNLPVKVVGFKGNNMELGALCGKPFSVSALAVIESGTSNILSL